MTFYDFITFVMTVWVCDCCFETRFIASWSREKIWLYDIIWPHSLVTCHVMSCSVYKILQLKHFAVAIIFRNYCRHQKTFEDLWNIFCEIINTKQIGKSAKWCRYLIMRDQIW